MIEWYEICSTDGLDTFNSLVKVFHQKYPFLKAYFEKEWWPFKERFIAYYTNKYTYFGELTTSRIEGSHSVIKGWLNTSQCNLYELYLRTKLCWDTQQNEYRWQMARSLSIPQLLSGEFFGSVRCIIHIYPLQEYIYKHLQEAKQAINEAKKKNQEPSLGICKGNFTIIFGMPCKHQILHLLTTQGVLLPKDFHQHWWIDRSCSRSCTTSAWTSNSRASL